MDYKRRLQTVRTELCEIEKIGADVAKSESTDDMTPLGKLGVAVASIARILLRVIDSLPG